MTAERTPATLNPTALSPADLARVLRAAGSRSATVERIQADLDAGAPWNADGTINVIHYAAWLLREGSRGD
jgi:hypothetical protein